MAENVDITLDAETPDDIEGQTRLGKKKLLVVIPAILLILAAQTVAAYFTVSYIFFSNPPMAPKGMVNTAANLAERDSTKINEVYEGTGELFEFEDIIVNPAGTMGRRYFVVSMSFEVSHKKVLEELKNKEPILRDALITLLAKKPLEFVADISNMEEIRSEILDTTNKYLTEGKVVRIFFTGYILQ